MTLNISKHIRNYETDYPDLKLNLRHSKAMCPNIEKNMVEQPTNFEACEPRVHQALKRCSVEAALAGFGHVA